MYYLSLRNFNGLFEEDPSDGFKQGWGCQGSQIGVITLISEINHSQRRVQRKARLEDLYVTGIL